MTEISVVIPAKNEQASLARLLPQIAAALPPDSEIIVVDDGSAQPFSISSDLPGLRIIRRPYNTGNGAAIKAGARAATGRLLLFMDADGQHDPAEIPALLAEYQRQDVDMLIGARHPGDHANMARRIANRVYSGLASWVVGHSISDLTSGFRIANAELFRQFLFLLPNGFSYPTTITMAFFRSGYTVGFAPIKVRARLGRSHIRPLRDGLRFLVIIFKVAALYAPLKVYLPLSALGFGAGLSLYGWTLLGAGPRFTNMALLCLLIGVMAFFIGLISEQLTAVIFHRQPKD